MAGIRHCAEDCFLDLQRRGLRGFEIGKRVLKEGFNLVGRIEPARVIESGAEASSSERT